MKIIRLILILPFILSTNFVLAQEKVNQDCKTPEKLVLENQAMLEQIMKVREEKAKLGLEINELRDRLKDKEISFQENLSAATQPFVEKALKLEKDLADINQRNSQKLSDTENQIKQSLEQQLQESKQRSESQKSELLEKIVILEAKVKELTGAVETKESLGSILKTKTDQLEQSNVKISKESEALASEVQTLKNTLSQLHNDLSTQSKSFLKSTQDYENLLAKYNQLSAQLKDSSFKLKQSDSREQNLKAVFDEQTKKLRSEFEAKEADYNDQKAKLQLMVNDHDEFVNNLKEDNSKLKATVDELTKNNVGLKGNWKKLTEESTAKIDILENNVVNAQSPYKERIFALEAKIQKFADECNQNITAAKAPLIEKVLDAEEKFNNQSRSFKSQVASIDSCQEKIKDLEAEQVILKNKINESQEKTQQANAEFNQKVKKSLETSQNQLNQANSELGLCQNNRSKDVPKHNELLEQNKKLLDEVIDLRNVKLKLEDNIKEISAKSNKELQSNNQEAGLKVKALNDSLDASRNQFKIIEASLQDSNKQNKDLSAQLVSLKKKNEELVNALTGKDSKHALLENNVSQIKKDASLEITALVSQLNDKVKLTNGLKDSLKQKEAGILKSKEEAVLLNQQIDQLTKQLELSKNQSSQLTTRIDTLTKETVVLNQNLNQVNSQLAKSSETLQAQLTQQKNNYEKNVNTLKAKLSDQGKLTQAKSEQLTQNQLNAQSLDKKLLLKSEELSRLKGQVDALTFKILEIEKSYAKDLAAQKEKYDVGLRQSQRAQNSLTEENVSLKSAAEEIRLLKNNLEAKLKEMTHQLDQVKAETQAKLIQEGYLSPKEVVSLKTSIKFLEKRLLDAENKLEEIIHKDDSLSKESNSEPVLKK